MSAPAIPETDRLAYSPQSAATLVDMSVSFIRGEIKDNKLPAYRIGKSIRIDRDELIEWLRSQPAA